MKTLILGDIHIIEKAIPEITEIVEDICFNKEWNQIVLLGDVYHRANPNAIEINFCTWMLTEMLKLAPVTIVTGNHEEISSTVSALDYSQHFGVNLIRHHGVIEICNRKLYVGHHFWDKGREFNKDEKYKVNDANELYDLAITGHDHLYKQYTDKVYCLGSLRRVSFGEVDYGEPKYAIVTLSASKSLQIGLCDVKTAYPMKDVYSVKEALKEPPRAKIRLVFKKFEDHLANINKIKELEKRFVEFTIKNDYKQITKTRKKKIKVSTFKETFNKFLETINNEQVRGIIRSCCEEV